LSVVNLGPLDNLQRLIRQLYLAINKVLTLPESSDELHRETELSRKILKRLHELLILPVLTTDVVKQYDRLYLVPYGILHQMPFACLFDGDAYLAQQTELVYLPTATSLSRRDSAAPTGLSVVMGESDGG
jgi:CHAT domain-containing protein